MTSGFGVRPGEDQAQVDETWYPRLRPPYYVPNPIDTQTAMWVGHLRAETVLITSGQTDTLGNFWSLVAGSEEGMIRDSILRRGIYAVAPFTDTAQATTLNTTSSARTNNPTYCFKG